MCSLETKVAWRAWTFQRKRFIRCILIDALDLVLVPACKFRQRLYNWTIYERRVSLAELTGLSDAALPHNEPEQHE